MPSRPSLAVCNDPRACLQPCSPWDTSLVASGTSKAAGDSLHSVLWGSSQCQGNGVHWQSSSPVVGAFDGSPRVGPEHLVDVLLWVRGSQSGLCGMATLPVCWHRTPAPSLVLDMVPHPAPLGMRAQHGSGFGCEPLPLQPYLIQGLDEGLDEPLPIVSINHASPDLGDTEDATEGNRAWPGAHLHPPQQGGTGTRGVQGQAAQGALRHREGGWGLQGRRCWARTQGTVTSSCPRCGPTGAMQVPLG